MGGWPTKSVGSNASVPLGGLRRPSVVIKTKAWWSANEIISKEHQGRCLGTQQP